MAYLTFLEGISAAAYCCWVRVQVAKKALEVLESQLAAAQSSMSQGELERKKLQRQLIASSLLQRHQVNHSPLPYAGAEYVQGGMQEELQGVLWNAGGV